MRQLIFILAIFFTGSNLSAQQKFCSKVSNTEALATYNLAVETMQRNKKDALDLFEKALSLEPNFVEAAYWFAVLNFSTGQSFLADEVISPKVQRYYQKATTNLNFVISKCPQIEDWSSFYYLGTIAYNMQDYQTADRHLQKYLANRKTGNDSLFNVTDMVRNITMHFELIKNPVPFNPMSLNGGINTADDEFLPLISHDGEMMFYTHRFKKRSPSAVNSEEVEEFTFSTRYLMPGDTNYRYTTGRKLPSPFNDGRNQGGASIVLNNNQLYLTICDYIRNSYTSYRNCDIFSTDFVDGKWTQLANLGANINSNETFEGQPTITGDGKVLFFVSARPGGLGGLDIYKAVKDSKGNWTKAVNLGPVINTAGDDKTPFIHTDSQTLYFASNGRFGIGGFDIYYSQYVGQGDWTEPKNLGFPINTKNDEVGFIVSANGNSLFFASNQLNLGEGGWDIFTSELYDEARPKQILFIKGTLFDEHGKGITDASITLEGTKKQIFTEGMVDRSTGKYAVAVPLDKEEEYILTAKKQGRIFKTAYINPNHQLLSVPTVIDFTVPLLKADTAFVFDNIFFEFNASALTKVSKECITKLAELLNENPNFDIEIAGHTDEVGTEQFNKQLSLKRSESVKKHLVELGIEPLRIKTFGYGKTRPLKKGSDEVIRAKNRRTEFILKNKK